MGQSEDRQTAAALRAHDRVAASGLENTKFVISSGSNSLRLLSTLNAGASIALLAFIGSIAGKSTPVFSSVTVFIKPMIFFGLGLLASAAATGGMYFAQYFYGLAVARMQFDWSHPYVHETDGSKRMHGWGVFFHVVTVILALGSFCLFGVGIYRCMLLIEGAKL
jgi:hypothetical protein